jgi:hypothetical protein
VASSICCRLFNSNCIEASKTEKGREIQVIGYTINLDLGFVSVAQKNYLRVIYGLSTIAFDKKIPIKTLQRFASWISRYSSISSILKPLSKTIYNAFSGLTNRYVKIWMSDQLRLTLPYSFCQYPGRTCLLGQ